MNIRSTFFLAVALFCMDSYPVFVSQVVAEHKANPHKKIMLLGDIHYGAAPESQEAFVRLDREHEAYVYTFLATLEDRIGSTELLLETPECEMEWIRKAEAGKLYLKQAELSGALLERLRNDIFFRNGLSLFKKTFATTCDIRSEFDFKLGALCKKIRDELYKQHYEKESAGFMRGFLVPKILISEYFDRLDQQEAQLKTVLSDTSFDRFDDITKKLVDRFAQHKKEAIALINGFMRKKGLTENSLLGQLLIASIDMKDANSGKMFADIRKTLESTDYRLAEAGFLLQLLKSQTAKDVTILCIGNAHCQVMKSFLSRLGYGVVLDRSQYKESQIEPLSYWQLLRISLVTFCNSSYEFNALRKTLLWKTIENNGPITIDGKKIKEALQAGHTADELACMALWHIVKQC